MPLSDSDDDSHLFRSRPLGGSLHRKTASSGSSASRAPMLQSVSSIAAKYARKPDTPAAEATASAAATPIPPAANSVTKAAPASDEAKPAATASAAAAGVPPFRLTKPSTKGLHKGDLDDSLETTAQPGASTAEAEEAAEAVEDSFFVDEPFTAPKPAAAPAAVAAPPADPKRYSYLDPKNPAAKPASRARDADELSSDEESVFKRTIKPLGSSLWNKSIEPKRKTTAAVAAAAATAEAAAAAQALLSPKQSDIERDEERKHAANDTRVRSPSPGPSPAQSRKDRERLEDAARSMSASQHPPSASGATFSPNAPRTLSLSAEYTQLQQAWKRQEEENRMLKQQLSSQQQRHASPSRATDLPPHLSHFSPSLSQRSPPPQQALASTSSDLDALTALQAAHAAERESNDATRRFLRDDSYYAPNIEMHEVLADNKRLRQRLRAAQHAIEALAAASGEAGAVDGAHLRAGGSASSVALLSPRSARGAYAPALNGVSNGPSALSLSQYAHLPPARAVLKLLNRLEREEEIYLEERTSWKADKSSLVRQIHALGSDLRHLTALASQSQENEIFFRRRELEHEAADRRVQADREQERAAWEASEREINDAALRERIRFHADIAKLERNDQHFKQKYDAVLAILRRYESERGQTGHLAADEQIKQQKKMFVILQREHEDERARLLEAMGRQEAKYNDLAAQLTRSEKTKDALLREQRAETSREQARRQEAEQQLLATQHQVTRSLDEKLQVLNSSPHVLPHLPPQQFAQRAEEAGAEIARSYAREREALQRQERDYLRHREHAREVDPESYRRGRSRSRAAESRHRDDPSSSSPSPPRARSSSRVLLGRTRFQPGRVASAQQILAMLPPDSEVHGQIELVLPSDGRNDGGYSDSARSRGRERGYARATFASEHAAMEAQRQFAPRRDSRSRSRSGERALHSHRERSRSGSRIRREVDQRTRRSVHYPDEPGSRDGVSVRVAKKRPTHAASAKPAATSNRIARAVYENDRYGRVSNARGM